MFLLFLHKLAADVNALLAALVPPFEGGGELFSDDTPDDPLPDVLDGVLGEGVGAAHRAGQHQVDRVQAQRQGHLVIDKGI